MPSRSTRKTVQLETIDAVRFVEADAAVFLEQLSTSRLVQAGAVNLIGLDAVRDRLDARWERRQADVWAYVDKAIDRLLPGQAYFRRISETDFVIAIAGADGCVAQAMCLKVLADTLTHFLGACAPTDLVIRNVASVGPGQITCAPVEIGALPRIDALPAPPPAAEHVTDQASIFASATGLSLGVDYVMEPFVSLRNGHVAGLCIQPVVRDIPTGRRLPGFVLSRLPDADLARIDSLGLAFAQRASTTTAKAQSMLAPLSFQTLSSPKLRAATLAELRARRLTSAWVVVLAHIDQGAPSSRLTEMAAFLRPHCEGVFACVPATSTSFGYLAECRFQGLVIDLERWANEPDRVVHYLKAFGEKAAGLASVLAVSGLASRAMFDVARLAGLTHASLRDTGGGRDLGA